MYLSQLRHAHFLIDGFGTELLMQLTAKESLVEGSGEHTPALHAVPKRQRPADIEPVELWGSSWFVEIFDSDGVVDEDEVDSLRCKRARFLMD
jgi:hypothetical protein